jgi:Type III flagellar switch regulator (C-ring) FliN C-term
MMEPATPAVLQSMILERLLGKPKSDGAGAVGLSKTGKAVLATLNASLKSGLSGKIGIELAEPESVPMHTWLKSLGEDDWIIAAPQREGDPNPVLFTLEGAAVSAFTSVAFGGGEPAAAGQARGNLTGIETDFLSVLADMFLPAALELAGAPLVKPVFFRADRFDASSVSSAAAAVFRFTLSLGARAWPLRIASFYEGAARPAADRPSRPETSVSWKSHLSEEIGRSRLSVEAVMDLHPQTLAKLKSLRAGDVIPIPEGNLRNCALRARGEPIYSGGLGRQGDVYSFRISAQARKRGGLMDSIVKGIDQNGTAHRSVTK